MPIHLIRHGEVSNPHGLVYADIPGFTLSAKGRRQATAAGEYLVDKPPRLIVSSPLDRATETAERIARVTGSDVVADARLTEWAVTVRWRGAAWADLPTVYPGELEAYLDDPRTIEFSSESITDLADRVNAAVTEWSARTDGDVAFISHEDPIHAAYLRLIDSSPARFHEGKPRHCAVLTLEQAEQAWHAAARWDPPQ
ncbi:MAG: histidine phosphatase family protein [Acidimicrobiia bacterium]|nr:histidine phosphatase family protein [Acidimicrobiia bacterium]